MSTRVRLLAALTALAVAIALLFVWRRDPGASVLMQEPSAKSPSTAEADPASSADQGTADADSVSQARLQVDAALAQAAASASEASVSNCRVRVIWADGRPAEGAIVRCLDDVRVQRQSDESEPQVRTADADGRAVFDAQLARTNVSAALDDHVSLPAQLSRRAEIVLTLRATVSAVGAITPSSELPETEVTVDCYALVASRRVHLARTKAMSGASWRLEGLPMAEVAQFLFRFEAETIMPLERERRAMTPGEELRVDVQIWPGTVRHVRVLTDGDEPLEGAEVVATYTNILNQVISYGGITDANGDCQLHGVPPREGVLIARKRGYMHNAYKDLIHAWLPADQVWTIHLAKAPVVRGVVRASGEPVENFDLSWLSPFTGKPQVREFRDAEGGEFLLDELEPGRVCLLAVSDAHGQSVPLNFNLTAEGAEGLVIEFDRRATVVGGVIDAVSEQPIEGAFVQPWSSSTAAMFAPRGDALAVDSNGRFRSSDFNAGINRMEVSAPGYAPRMIGVQVAAGEEVDAGVIRLSRTASLEVEFLAGPDIVVTESYATGTAGAGASGVLATAVFDASGRTRFDNVAPGDWTVRVMLSNGYELYSGIKLVPGEPWRLTVDHAQLSYWVVDMRKSDGSPAVGWTGYLHWTDSQARRWIGAAARENGHARMLTPKQRACVLRIYDDLGVWVRDQPVGPAEYAVDPFKLTVDEPRSVLRVRDGSGAPLAGVAVASLSRQFGASPARTASTDVEGLVTLFVDGDVSYTHGTLGIGVRLGLRDSDRRAGVYELELDPAGPLEISVRDGSFVVAGAELELGVAGYWLSRPRTDARGVAKTIPLSAGSWDVRLNMPGYWPAKRTFEVRRGTTQAELQVRRLGDVAFEVRSASGAAVQGLSVELESVEFGERASEWLAAQRIEASANELRLDSDGKVELKGLPHGAYRWTVSGAEGVLASGEVVLAPRARTSVEARVP